MVTSAAPVTAIQPPPGFQLESAPQPTQAGPPNDPATASPTGIKPPPGFQIESHPTAPQPDLPGQSLLEGGERTLKAAYNDIGQSVKGVGDLVDHIIGYTASDNAKTELARGWTALKSGSVAEAQNHLRAASEDIVTNHPVSQLLKQQWDSSARNKQAVEEDMKNGDHLAVVQHAAGILPVANVVSDAFDKAIKEPTPENIVHATITGAMAMSPAIVKGAGMIPEAAEGAEASEVAPAEAAAETPKEPGIIKQVVQGEKVAQKPAQNALRGAAGADSGSDLRESLSKPIEDEEQQATGLYKQIDEAAGTDFKGLGDKLRKVNRAIRNSVDDAEEAKLGSRRDAIESAIEEGKQRALENGVDPDTINQADAHFKKMSALTDVERRVFKNVNVVDPTTGDININAAVKELQKLQDSEKFGAPRLEQAFGPDSTLLEDLKAANRLGTKAMKRQALAKSIARYAGIPTAVGLYEAGKEVLQ